MIALDQARIIILRPLGDDEVRLRSFGRVWRIADNACADWRSCTGSIYDQAIFGGTKNWTCACGRYTGVEWNDMVCDICGVHVGNASQDRLMRFGHIEFNKPITHPLLSEALLHSILVLPIGLRCRPSRSDLDYLYSCVLSANVASQSGSQGDTQYSAGDLEYAVMSLFANELQPNPMQFENRVLRSLCHYAFADFDRSETETGWFLNALGLRIEYRG